MPSVPTEWGWCWGAVVLPRDALSTATLQTWSWGSLQKGFQVAATTTLQAFGWQVALAQSWLTSGCATGGAWTKGEGILHLLLVAQVWWCETFRRKTRSWFLSKGWEGVCLSR